MAVSYRELIIMNSELGTRNSVTHCLSLLVPILFELTAHSSRYIAAARAAWKTQPLLLKLFTEPLNSNGRCADPIENILSIVEVVYRAVAWQRVDQILYNMYIYIYIMWRGA
jgi:hypothetical protein